MNILDQFGPLEDFEPESIAHYVVLQIARRFDDLPNLASYLRISQAFSADEMARAFHRALHTPSRLDEPAEHFRRHLHS